MKKITIIQIAHILINLSPFNFERFFDVSSNFKNWVSHLVSNKGIGNVIENSVLCVRVNEKQNKKRVWKENKVIWTHFGVSLFSIISIRFYNNKKLFQVQQFDSSSTIVLALLICENAIESTNWCDEETWSHSEAIIWQNNANIINPNQSNQNRIQECGITINW